MWAGDGELLTRAVPSGDSPHHEATDPWRCVQGAWDVGVQATGELLPGCPDAPRPTTPASPCRLKAQNLLPQSQAPHPGLPHGNPGLGN